MPIHTSVVVVSDYGNGAREEEELLRVLAALGRQDIQESVEFLLVHEKDNPSFDRTLPGLRVVTSSARSSYQRKNEGAAAAQGEWIALLDGDCVPASGWLSCMVSATKAHPSWIAFSGPTYYAGRDLTSRALSLLARGYLDPGEEGETRYIANNNCLMRRDAYLAFPLPERAGPFAAHMQSESLRRAGFRFRFVIGASVTHGFEGWAMERDLRRNTGFITIHGRHLDPSLRYSRLLKLGWASLPFFAAGKLLHRWGDLFRCRRRFGIGWMEMPAAAALACCVQALELPGMIRALRRQPLGPSAWR